MARRRKLNYTEGSRFLVPLQNGGFGLGVVARMDGKGSVFGYFFGPKLNSTNSLDLLQNPNPCDAVMVRSFGDLGFLTNKWLVLDTLSNWDRAKWPMPPLIRVDEHAGKAFLSTYDDRTFKCLREEKVALSLVNQYPPDVSSGYVAIEIHLTNLLDPEKSGE